MVRKSLKNNSFIVMLNKLLDALFPIITFSLVVRALGVEKLGLFSYSNSIIHYFVLVAGLGVETYAIREGSRIRDDKEKIGRFVGEMFGLNVVTSLITYLILCIYVFIFLQDGLLGTLIWVASFQIITTPLGMEWVITVYEDFSFILFRNLIFKALTLLSVFVFVRTEEDLIVYAIIIIISTVGTNLANLFSAKKRTDFSVVISKELKKYFFPLLRMFLIHVLIDIYSNVDVTMLGALAGSIETGYYTAALKVYSVLCAVMSSVAIAAYPQISALEIENDKKEYHSFCDKFFDLIFVFSLPTMVGVIILKEEIIEILCGVEFANASKALGILAIAFGLNIANWYWTRAYILPLKKDSVLIFASLFTSLENVILNFWFIPVLGHIGAAITTVLAEFTVSVVCVTACWKYVKNIKIRNFIKTVCGCIGVAVVVVCFKVIIKVEYVRVILAVLSSVLVYFGIEIVLKHDFIMELIDMLKRKNRD